MNNNVSSSALKELNGIPIEEIEVLFFGRWGDMWWPLQEWIQQGPGEQRLRAPVSVRHRVSQERLSLDIIPIQYRNNTESRRLIREGNLQDPWSHILLPGLTLEDMKMLDQEVDDNHAIVENYWDNMMASVGLTGDETEDEADARIAEFLSSDASRRKDNGQQ